MTPEELIEVYKLAYKKAAEPALGLVGSAIKRPVQTPQATPPPPQTVAARARSFPCRNRETPRDPEG